MYDFKSISIYFDKSRNLIGVPSTIDEKCKMIRDIDCVCQLDAPYDNSQIEDFLLEVFRKCYSREHTKNERPTVLQDYLGERSYSAAVKNRGMVNLTWSKAKGYKVTPTWKNARLKNAFVHMSEKSIPIQAQYDKGELAEAFLEALRQSPIKPAENFPAVDLS